MWLPTPQTLSNSDETYLSPFRWESILELADLFHGLADCCGNHGYKNYHKIIIGELQRGLLALTKEERGLENFCAF